MIPPCNPGRATCTGCPNYIYFSSKSLNSIHFILRFGSFEILTSNGEYDLLRDLADFVITHYFPQVEPSDNNRYLSWFSEIVRTTSHMIALWMSVGFAHGVLNTDNFSIIGDTIDYGPFGFMDEYDPGMVPNTSDDEHRYSYEKQPDVGR